MGRLCTPHHEWVLAAKKPLCRTATKQQPSITSRCGVIAEKLYTALNSVDPTTNPSAHSMAEPARIPGPPQHHYGNCWRGHCDNSKHLLDCNIGCTGIPDDARSMVNERPSQSQTPRHTKSRSTQPSSQHSQSDQHATEQGLCTGVLPSAAIRVPRRSGWGLRRSVSCVGSSHCRHRYVSTGASTSGKGGGRGGGGGSCGGGGGGGGGSTRSAGRRCRRWPWSYCTTAVLLAVVAVVAAAQAYDISLLQLSSFRGPLPLVVLASPGWIPNEPKGPAGLLVSGCSSTPEESQGSDGGVMSCCLACELAPELVMPVGAELRGRSSQAVEKKSYAVELRWPNGSSAPAPLLGLPPAADWVLNSLALDRSLLRDGLAFELARAQGRWASRFAFVELFVVEGGTGQLDTNMHYRGVYAVTESIDRGPNRVDVRSLKDSDLTGGYILELSNAAATEWWAGQLGEPLPAPVTRLGPTRADLKYPKPSRAPSAAWYYVAGLLSNVSSTLSHSMLSSSSSGTSSSLRALLDLPSLADMLLHTELACDYDGYVSSVYFHKNRGGTLVAGPVWDKNLAYGNEVEVTSPTGCAWRYAAPAVQNSGQVAVWMGALARVGWWRKKVAARWRQLRTEGDAPWSDGALQGLVERLRNRLLDLTARRNFDRWPLRSITSNQRFVTLPSSHGSWEAEVESLRNWLLARARWLDSQLLGPGEPQLATPPPPNRVTGVVGAVLAGRPVTRAVQEGWGVRGA